MDMHTVSVDHSPHLEDCTSTFMAPMAPISYPLRFKKSHPRAYEAKKKKQQQQQRELHDLIMDAGREWPVQVPGRDDWSCGMLMDATRLPDAAISPDCPIYCNPTGGFADSPLTYFAREMPLVDHEDLHTYHQQLIATSSNRYAASVHRWVDLLWNVAQSHELLFRGIIVFARYQNTSAAHRSFLNSKTQILRLISGRMQHPRHGSHHDGNTLVSIALLAYSDMKDGDFEAAETHLKALPVLSPAEYWSPYEWVYIAWIDLRLALLRGQRPTLPYYIPSAFREPPISMAQQGARARKLALSNTKHGPRKPLDQAFTNVCFHMFSSLHEMSLAWDALHHSGEVPFGTLYDLEYSLRTMQDDIWTAQRPGWDDRLKELILLCIQLQTWILHRFWTPQRPETYIIVVHRAQTLLEELTSLPSSDATPDAVLGGLADLLNPACIMWITFTFAGIAMEFGHPCQTISVRILASAAKCVQIKNHGDLSRHLKKWPWLDNWHKSKLELLWPKIRPLLGLPHQRWQNVVNGSATADEGRVEQPPTSKSFFGGLEFYVEE